MPVSLLLRISNHDFTTFTLVLRRAGTTFRSFYVVIYLTFYSLCSLIGFFDEQS